MQIFFFKHPLVSQPFFDRFIPGRYGYDVEGRALAAKDRSFRLEGFNGRIYGDAYGNNKPGSNVDPNVLSDTIPWFLSFCRISDRDKLNNLVRSENALLSEVVHGGDIIIFGGDDKKKLGKGSRLQTDKFSEISVGAVLELFCCGNGFNICPLLQPETDYSPLTISEEIAARPGIFVTKIDGISASISRSNVSRLSTDLAKSLLESIFQQSEKLVLDPVIPTTTLTPDNSRNH